MNKKSILQKLPIIAIGVAIACTGLAFQQQPFKTKPAHADTLPDGNRKVRNIDDALEELERSKAEVDRSLKEIDFTKMEKEIQEATKNLQLDSKKMQEELAQAMKEVDRAKINADIQKAFQEENLVKMKANLDSNMKAVDFDKIKAEIENSVAKVDFDKIHAELEKAKSVNMDSIRSNLKQIRPEIERSMKQAHESIDKARKELTGYKNFIDGLTKDGLINKNNEYTIQYKGGQLIINGKEQPAAVTNKYQSFLKEKKDFTIEKSKDDFNIKND